MTRDDALPRQWLYFLAFLACLLVLLSAISRLDHAGPLLATFAPISNLLPPLSSHGWQTLFDRFQQAPGFSVDEDVGMNLAEFERAYLWEWAHLLVEHVMDVALLLGLVGLFARKNQRRRIGGGFQILILLGVGHVLLGWWLGHSGIAQRKSLAQFVNAGHLISTCILYVWSIWLARRLTPPSELSVSRRWLWATAGLGAVVFIQLVSGAFVAGLQAGTVFNTWPLMDGALIPKGLWFFTPWWKNLVENALMAQFTHRMIGYLTLLYTAALLLLSRLPNQAPSRVRHAAAWIFALALTQGCLGVATVLSVASIPLAVAHLVAALALMGVLTMHVADASRAVGFSDVRKLGVSRTSAVAE